SRNVGWRGGRRERQALYPFPSHPGSAQSHRSERLDECCSASRDMAGCALEFPRSCRGCQSLPADRRIRSTTRQFFSPLRFAHAHCAELTCNGARFRAGIGTDWLPPETQTHWPGAPRGLRGPTSLVENSHQSFSSTCGAYPRCLCSTIEKMKGYSTPA